MERGGEEEGGLVVRGRVEIDMRQPFRSVKEAISLFGERVLAGEIYANKLKEMQIKKNTGKYTSKIGGDHHDEQTKQQSVEKEKEESNNLMVHCLNSLRQELEQTKMELKQLKSKESHIENDKQFVEPEIEELKFIENTAEIKKLTEEENGLEFERKRSVKFASPPLLTRVIINTDDGGKDGEQKPSPKKNPKKKPLVSLMGGLFLKKEGKQRK
ncbi:Hypothetical predicted protein [Olea europaea subsp. europaea]|uniref:WEB family protein n=1 Tax=Olea europaea subsp. europaea TaxID=158383 RepID=A0A8S0Q937_OLEEU|nr:Hypothetical predicted protein [Olea europaea subsp. europaea]